MKTETAGVTFGEYRACSPDETFLKVRPHLAALGITRVADQTGLDRLGIPVWCAYAPNAKAIVIAQGKGLDKASAKISAVMEAVERVVATEPSCHVEMSTASEHEGRGQSCRRLDCLIAGHQTLLGAHERAAWVEADSLVDGSKVWLPFDAVDFDRTRLSPRYWQSSDGLASGNTAEEAILHGLLERVERDALALWNVTSARRRFDRRIDSRGLTSPVLLDLLLSVERAELKLCLFDITTDLGIPVVAALLTPQDTDTRVRYVDLTLGAGAGLTPEGAIIRALLEAVQSRMTFIAGARDDLMPSVFERAAEPEHFAAFAAPCAVVAEDIPTLIADTTHLALDVMVKQLLRRGVNQLFAVKLQPDWLPVSVVKVFAPQLENPDGARRLRFGSRALSRSLQ